MTSNIVKELEKHCLEAGTNLTDLCEDAGINNRGKLSGWKDKEPYTIETLRDLIAALRKRAAANNVELPEKLLL